MKLDPQQDNLSVSPSGEYRVDQQCTAFEQAWKAGTRERIEDWLPRVPQSEQTRLLRELMLVELELRRAAGESPQAGDYRQRFPEQIDVVEAAFNLIDGKESDPSQAATIIVGSDQDTSQSDPDIFGPAVDAEPLPETIGRYPILSILGKGAFGKVYLARDPKLERQVAIKVALASQFSTPQGRERFLLEARSAASLDHPGIVRVYDVDETGDLLYIVQQYVDGRNLAACVLLERWPRERIVSCMIEVSRALAFAHKRGLVHCDLKPANILIDRDGNPHVADFGLAIDEKTQRARRGDRAGTPRYMSPEQVRGDVHRLDGRSDIWSLGVMLYELIAGRPPFVGSTRDELFDEILNRDPKPPRMIDDKIPAELERIILRCLAKRITDRYSTAFEVASDLQKLGRRPKRWRWITAAAVVLVLAIPIGIAWRLATFGKFQGEPTQTSIPAAAAPLRVMGIDVQHFAHTPKGDEPRGLIGQQTFTPSLGDRVQVKARLSKPAYAYLIAFRPDGAAELCFPESEDVPPALADSPQYPIGDGGKAYGLREGMGLWVFAVVASETPLPAYREWLKGRLQNDSGWSPVVDIPPRIVWWDDGQGQVSILTAANPGHPVRDNERGKDETLEGPARIIGELTASLRTRGDAKTASAIGFCVVP